MSNETYESGNLIATGNAVSQGNENSHRGWFIGSFVDPMKGLRHSEEVEVKWGVHSAGQGKPFPDASEGGTTLTLLVQGKFIVDFPELCKSVCLREPGDYVIFAPKMLHGWTALEDSIVLTVRWLSVNANRTTNQEKLLL